jgi:hypothetical protein
VPSLGVVGEPLEAGLTIAERSPAGGGALSS